MNSTDVVGYTYEASLHCPDCARERAAVGLLKREPPLEMGTDMHGLAYDLVDREGNLVTPVFVSDATEGDRCDDCGEELMS